MLQLHLLARCFLFFIPSVKRPNQAVLPWDVAEAHLPWGVFVLMGGGFALAKGFTESKLTDYIGEAIAGLVAINHLGLTYIIILVVCFLTEVTSNTATANVILPILASVSQKTLTNPLILMLPATCACSFAFMLPAATPPNMVVFGTHRVELRDFLRAGIIINCILILTASLVVYLMANAIFDPYSPYKQDFCQEKLGCIWVNESHVYNTEIFHGQACSIADEPGLCKLKNGALYNYTAARANPF